MKTVIEEIQCGIIIKMIFWINRKDTDVSNEFKKINEDPTNKFTEEEILDIEFDYNYKLNSVEVFKHPNSKNDIYKLSGEGIKRMNEIIQKTESEKHKMKFKEWDW